MKKVITLVLVLLGCMIFLSSCNQSGGGVDQGKIAAYLKAIGPDFQQSKEDLKVFSEDFSEDISDFSSALDEVKTSKDDFTARMEKVKKQDVPGSPKEIVDFHNSLVEYYSDSISIMDEYEQILTYCIDLYKSIEPLENTMSNFGGSDMFTAVKSLKVSIDQSTAAAEKCSPPSYMADSHANYVNALKGFSSATVDFYNALQLSDPLRINATTYRFELLSNKIGHIGDEMDKEIEVEETKMTELGDKLEKNQDDLYKQLLIWQSQYKIGS
jgi:hypothetical protein